MIFLIPFDPLMKNLKHWSVIFSTQQKYLKESQDPIWSSSEGLKHLSSRTLKCYSFISINDKCSSSSFKYRKNYCPPDGSILTKIQFHVQSSCFLFFLALLSAFLCQFWLDNCWAVVNLYFDVYRYYLNYCSIKFRKHFYQAFVNTVYQILFIGLLVNNSSLNLSRLYLFDFFLYTFETQI